MVLAFATLVTASAQKEQGDVYLLPRVGMNSSWLKGNDMFVDSGDNEWTKCESSAKIGLTAGCEAEYMVRKALGVRAGLLYSVQGDKLKVCGDMGDLKTTLGYVCVPLMATLYVSDMLGISAGVQYSRMVHSNANDAAFKKNDISIPIGMSVEYGGVVAELKYVFGLTDIENVAVGGNGVKNRSLWLTLGYRVGL